MQTKIERDDGSPIPYQQKPAQMVAMLGCHIDNVYKQIDNVREIGAEFGSVKARLLLGESA